MTSHRTTLRRTAIALLEAHPFFAAATRVLSSAQVDVATLPCYSVNTPSEDSVVQSAVLTEVRTNLVIAAKVAGPEDRIEDDLDDLADLIESLILADLTAQAGPQNVQLKRTEFKTGPEDKTIIGSVMMLFEVVGYLQET